jgi:hypothetical protein
MIEPIWARIWHDQARCEPWWHWSQVDSLGANVAVPWPERTPRDDVDSDTQQVLQILEQAGMIKKGGAWLEIDKQVEVTIWASLTPSDGAEHRDPASPALPRDTEDLRAVVPQSLQGQYVIGHGSKVSPHTGTGARGGLRTDGHPCER